MLKSIKDFLKKSIQGWLNSNNPAAINIYNIINVVKGYIISNSLYQKYIMPNYLKEQVYLRAILSEACLKNVWCVECGCTQSKKIFINTPCAKIHNKDGLFCYDYFLSKKDWENVKKVIDLQLLETGKKLLEKHGN